MRDECGHQECNGIALNFRKTVVICPSWNCIALMDKSPIPPQMQWHHGSRAGVDDVWFDSGHALPQMGYPIKCEEFEDQFPADYIGEAIDQPVAGLFATRIRTLYMNQNVSRMSSVGLILDEKGHKMSKHIGNVISLK